MIRLLPVLFAIACDQPTRTPGVVAAEIVVPELSADMGADALDALARDARRREARFVEAAAPGSAIRATRVGWPELAAGLWSPREIYQIGGQLFNLTFTVRDGFGGADLPTLRRFHTGQRGGPDATSCASCHWRGGPAGAGDGADNAYLDGDGDSQSSAFARNPRPLVGAGLIELLAAEMSADLAATRDALLAASRKKGEPLKADLQSKGVSFGWIGASSDGTLDTRGLRGVSADLVVRPFGWKGSFSNLRDAVEDELSTHHGMQSVWLARHGGPARVGDHGGEDPDGDGVINEITEGQVAALTFYLAMQELPITQLPTRESMLAQWSEGARTFQAVGCASCHVPSMTLKNPVYTLTSRDGGEPITVNLALDGADPKLQPGQLDGGYQVYLFSDLARHDMGTRLAEPREDRGVEGSLFMTPPLWGLARSRPYMHDGRAPTVEDAIFAHGGEAAAARDAYVALPNSARYPLRLYLAGLNRAPRLVSP